MSDTMFFRFDANGNMIEAIAADKSPGTDWFAAPVGYTGEPVKLVNGAVEYVTTSDLDAAALANKQDEAVGIIKRFASDVRAKVAKYADAYQLAGWNEKVRRAEKVLAKTATTDDIAVLQTECDSRGKGETPAQLAALQIAKSNALAKAVALIDGMESSALASVKQATSTSVIDKLLVDLQTSADAALAKLTV